MPHRMTLSGGGWPADSKGMDAERTWRRDAVITGAAVLVVAAAFLLQWPVPVLLLIDLAVHEVARLVTAPLPAVVTALSGWVAQVAFPLFLACYFLIVRRDRVLGGFAFVWAGASARDVSAFAADAATQTMGRVGVGSASEWPLILGPQGFDMLDRAAEVGSAIWSVGAMMALAGIIIGASGAVRSMADYERRIDLDRVLGAGVGADPWNGLLRSPAFGDPWRATHAGGSRPLAGSPATSDEGSDPEPGRWHLVEAPGGQLRLVVDVVGEDGGEPAEEAKDGLLLSS